MMDTWHCKDGQHATCLALTKTCQSEPRDMHISSIVGLVCWQQMPAACVIPHVKSVHCWKPRAGNMCLPYVLVDCITKSSLLHYVRTACAIMASQTMLDLPCVQPVFFSSCLQEPTQGSRCYPTASPV